MKSYEEIFKLKEPLEEDYRSRHEAHKRLRDFWHGRYWDKLDSQDDSISSIFRDLTSRQSDVGPDIKLTYNVLKDVCVKFQTFLAPLPMIRSYVDPPSSPTRRNQATLKERYLYGLWSANNMSKQLADSAWYLPLMGDCFHGIFPDVEKNLCRSIIRSPEYAYPIPSFDTDGLDGVIFKWDAHESAVKRMFPDYVPQSSRNKGRFRLTPRRAGSSDPVVEIIEYSDKGEFQRFADTQRMNGVDHDFGFNLFEQMKFINVPGEVFGHGAVEQSVNLVEMGNAYLSLMMQSAIENVFPAMVLIDPQKAPEQIEKGGGAVIPVNAGGDVKYLTPPSGSLFANAQWGHEIERMIQTDTSMPDVNFGQFRASIVTGKAINELQGAGTGSLVEMVQGVSIGSALTSWNEKAIQIGRTMFKDETIYLYGTETGTLADINPRHFAMKIKGSQLIGSTRNEVVFLPHLDMHSKVVMGLQLAGAGLVSKQWQREQVGIPDSEAMDEEILSEAVQEATVSFFLQQLTDPSLAPEVEKDITSYIEGTVATRPPILGITAPQTPGAPGGPPALGPAGPQGMPPGMPPPGMMGGAPGAGAPAGMMGGASSGAPVPPGAPTPPPQPGQPSDQTQAEKKVVTLEEATRIRDIPGIEGKVYLVGEIVQRGETDAEVEVDVTEPHDRDVIARAVEFPVTFRIITTKPDEPYVEISPGGEITQGGTEPHPDQLHSEA